MNDTDARLWHPWLRINRVLRAMLHERWSAEAWPQVKAEFKKALALKTSPRLSDWCRSSYVLPSQSAPRSRFRCGLFRPQSWVSEERRDGWRLMAYVLTMHTGPWRFPDQSCQAFVLTMDEVRSPLLLQRRESRDRCADLKYPFLTPRWAAPTLVSLARSPREWLVATGADMLSSDQATQEGGGSCDGEGTSMR